MKIELERLREFLVKDSSHHSHTLEIWILLRKGENFKQLLIIGIERKMKEEGQKNKTMVQIMAEKKWITTVSKMKWMNLTVNEIIINFTHIVNVHCA
jgi:hypothetical protein